LELSGGEQSVYHAPATSTLWKEFQISMGVEGWMDNRWFGKENMHKPHMKIMQPEQVHCHFHIMATIEL
jgi:hypothetical protein